VLGDWERVASGSPGPVNQGRRTGFRAGDRVIGTAPTFRESQTDFTGPFPVPVPSPYARSVTTNSRTYQRLYMRRYRFRLKRPTHVFGKCAYDCQLSHSSMRRKRKHIDCKVPDCTRQRYAAGRCKTCFDARRIAVRRGVSNWMRNR